MSVFSNVASHKQFRSLENIFRPYVTYTKRGGAECHCQCSQREKEEKRAKLRSFPHIRIKRKKRKEMRDIVISPPSSLSFARQKANGAQKGKREGRKKSGKERLRKKEILKFEIRDPPLFWAGKAAWKYKSVAPFFHAQVRPLLTSGGGEVRV